ncbi:hypothetical protein [Streptomyces sp. NPDC127098]|uniref:hypothetical protein n=1 Tax=Streptomyces sp. NPDC127098 TaxID=3347137 RepID=UPI003662E033
MAELIEAARTRGYSRTAKGCEPNDGPDAWCVIVAVLYEAVPEPAWICLVWQPSGSRGYRLDTALHDFAGLGRLRAAQKDRVIQELITASTGRTGTEG